MYDKTIADLEDKLAESDGILRFFKAYIAMQHHRLVKISDLAVQVIDGKEEIEIIRGDGCTVIKLK